MGEPKPRLKIMNECFSLRVLTLAKDTEAVFANFPFGVVDSASYARLFSEFVREDALDQLQWIEAIVPVPVQRPVSEVLSLAAMTSSKRCIRYLCARYVFEQNEISKAVQLIFQNGDVNELRWFVEKSGTNPDLSGVALIFDLLVPDADRDKVIAYLETARQLQEVGVANHEISAIIDKLAVNSQRRI